MDKSSYSLTVFANQSLHVVSQFCRTMTSRGEIVRNVLKEQRYSVTRVAEKIRISRAQLYNDFSNPEMSFDRILAIGKAIGHDFSQDFKELSPELVSVASKELTPVSAALNDCRDKLIETQTQLISTLHELSQYKKKYGELDNT